VNLLKNQDGKSKGMAFVKFTEEKGQNEALEYNETEF